MFADAQVGSGDAHAQLARLCLCSIGSRASHQASSGDGGSSREVQAATAHQQRSIDAYSESYRRRSRIVPSECAIESLALAECSESNNK